jgi:hypothetical protein
MTCCQYRWFLMLVGLLGLDGLARAQDRAAFAMPLGEFQQLSAAEQKALLGRVFEHRLEHAKNIYFEVQVRMAGYEYRNGQVGKKTFDANGRNYRLWRLVDAYRMASDRGGIDVAIPIEFVNSGFDPREGIGKSTVRFKGNNRAYGRIDSVHDISEEDNRLTYWLDGKHPTTGWGEYIFRFLVDNKDSYVIETPVDQNMVRLKVPWITIVSPEPWGTREFILDPSKGFLPIRGKGRWETDKFGDGKTHWRVEEFEVGDSQLVGDVWMPLHLKEIIVSSRRANACNVLETKVTKIEWGTVKPEDLEVAFSPGMRIVDAIKGDTYVVGENGEPTQVQPVVGREAQPLPAAPGPRRTDWTYVLIGVGLLCAVLVAVLWKLRRKNRAKAVA